MCREIITSIHPHKRSYLIFFTHQHRKTLIIKLDPIPKILVFIYFSPYVANKYSLIYISFPSLLRYLMIMGVLRPREAPVELRVVEPVTEELSNNGSNNTNANSGLYEKSSKVIGC